MIVWLTGLPAAGKTTMRQRLTVACYGAAGCGLLVQSIAGTGAGVSVYASLS